MIYYVNKNHEQSILKKPRFFINKTEFIQKTDKEIDGNNFLVAYDVPIAKTGIQQYSREEIGDINGSPGELVNVYRDPSVFQNQKLLETFDGIPIVYCHPDNGKVDNLNFKHFVVGTVSGVYHKNGDLYAKKITIIDKNAILNVLKKETNELSIGFKGEIIKSNGFYKGIPYEFKEDIIHANHLALCESGKAGPKYAINSKNSKQKGKNMDPIAGMGMNMEEDCMGNEGDIVPKEIQEHIEQVISKKLSQIKPEMIGYGENEKSLDKDEEESLMNEEGEEEKEKMNKKNESDPELEKSEHKDKDVINALKNSNNKLRILLNQKNKEISRLIVQNTEAEDALTEALEYMKNMDSKLKSSSISNAMTGPDHFKSFGGLNPSTIAKAFNS